jgi:hypothetical protein
MKGRYRMVMGETHDQVHVNDDVNHEKVPMYPVDLLNEYDLKVNLMEKKLNELGYSLEYWESENNDFEGQWVVVEEVE